MRGRAALAGVAAVASACAVLLSGCGSNATAPPAPSTDTSELTPPDGRTLRPISLPDLSHATESVREQIRERYSALMLETENQATRAVELNNAYGEMGKLFMAAEYFDAAEDCFLNAQVLAPSDVRWPYYLGHLYKAKGAPAKSAAYFEQTLELRPEDVATLVWLGDAYLAQGRPEAAEPLLAKAVSLQPRSAAALAGLGRAALAGRDYVRAVDHLERALALDERASIIHYPLATAYRGLGELAKAEAHLRQRGYLEIDLPDPLMQQLHESLQSATAYESRGIRDLERGEWAAAAEAFRKGIELAPDRASLRHRLGTALLLMGDAGGAQEQFEEALRLSPEFARAHYSLGVMILRSGGRPQEALERFSAAVKYEPDYLEARLLLADVLRASGRAEDSLPHYEHVVKIDPRVADARFGYAMALVRLKRYQEARDRLAEGMKVHPDQPQFAHALARLLAAAPDDRVRDGRRAMALMQELLKQQRTLELDETMAMTLAELGNYEEATAWQRNAMAAAKQEGRDDLVVHMAENLRLYKRRQPCRTPWRVDEMP